MRWWHVDADGEGGRSSTVGALAKVQSILVEADVGPDCAVAGVAAVEKHELDDDASRRSKRNEIVGWRGQASEKNVPDNLGGNGFAQVTVRMSVALELAEAFTSLADEVAESWLFEAAVSVCGVDGRKVGLQ